MRRELWRVLTAWLRALAAPEWPADPQAAAPLGFIRQRPAPWLGFDRDRRGRHD